MTLFIVTFHVAALHSVSRGKIHDMIVSNAEVHHGKRGKVWISNVIDISAELDAVIHPMVFLMNWGWLLEQCSFLEYRHQLGEIAEAVQSSYGMLFWILLEHATYWKADTTPIETDIGEEVQSGAVHKRDHMAVWIFTNGIVGF
jgi:hypothetical protein